MFAYGPSWKTALAGVTALAFTASAAAQTAGNVVVVINETSPVSVKIGEYYIAKRGIPAQNVVRLRATAEDEIERARFEYDVERPISEALTRYSLQDQILYIVLTKGIPLRVRGTGGLDGTVASVDSELAVLYRKLLGIPSPPAGRIANPYYLANRPLVDAKRFSHVKHDIYLVTRLDGFTVDDAIGLIDRAAAPARDGVFVLDQRASAGNRIGDDWLGSAAERLAEGGHAERVMLEHSSAPAATTAPALGYYSWGSNDPALTSRRVGVTFAPGALAGAFVSTDGRTFTEPPASWTIGRWGDQKGYFAGSPQSLAGDLIRAGATGVVSHVAEPFLDGSARPQIVFPAYVAGFNLAEAFYLAIPYLSWQNVVVGDPLCAPFKAAALPPDELNPPLDPETELPRFFSARRLDVLASYDVRPQISKLMLKASARLLHADLDGAAKALEAVTVVEPALNAAHFVLATIYDVSGQSKRAVERYQTILATAPNEVRALNNLAYALAVGEKSPKDALPFAQKAYTIAHDNAVELTLDVGYAVAARKGTPPNVLPFAPVGYNVSAVKAQIADTLGWIQHLLGNNAIAEKYLTQAGAGAPDNAEVQLHVAMFKASLAQFDEARKALQNAITLDAKMLERSEVKELQARLKVQPK